MLAALAASACTGEAPSPAPAAPSGPPAVQPDAVARHAEQFSELGDRPAGSQAEQAASVYLLGHLQQAGYAVLLDAVPVGDLVRSTNVVALPPAGGEPGVVVVTPYDTGPGHPGDPHVLGLFLELARALRAAVPDHGAEFVALGADNAEAPESHLGSRRLARTLVEAGDSPFVVVLEDENPCPGFAVSVAGRPPADLRAVLLNVARERPDGCGPASSPARAIFTRAGLDAVSLVGDPKPVGRLLLTFLAERRVEA